MKKIFLFIVILCISCVSFAQERIKVVVFTSSQCRWCRVMDEDFLHDFVKTYAKEYNDQVDLIILTSPFKEFTDAKTGKTYFAPDDNDIIRRAVMDTGAYYKQKGFYPKDDFLGFPTIIAGNSIFVGYGEKDEVSQTWVPAKKSVQIHAAIKKAIDNKEKTYISPLIFGDSFKIEKVKSSDVQKGVECDENSSVCPIPAIQNEVKYNEIKHIIKCEENSFLCPLPLKQKYKKPF